MFKKYIILLLMSFFLIGFLGCEELPFLKKPVKKKVAVKGPPEGVTVVARVGQFYVTSEDLNAEVKNFNALLEAQGIGQNKITTRDQKIAYLRDEVVRRYILYQEALDRGNDKKKEVIQALRNTKITLLVTELLRQETEKVDVSSKEIEDFYNQNKALFREPEERRVFEIVTTAESQAKQVYIELLQGRDFASLARQYSKAESAGKGGDLGLLTLELDPAKRIKFDKFYEVAFSPTLEVGGISGIFKGPDGFYIIKLQDRKQPKAISLTDLWDKIKGVLLFEKQQKVITDLANKLSAETKIEIHESKVE